MEISMRIDGADPFTAVKPDARLIKLLVRAHGFNTTLVQSDGVAFAALALREGVSRSYFTRVVRLSYLAPDITQAILDGRQPRDLTAQKLLGHSRLPLAWHDQRTALGFARARSELRGRIRHIGRDLSSHIEMMASLFVSDRERLCRSSR